MTALAFCCFASSNINMTVTGFPIAEAPCSKLKFSGIGNTIELFATEYYPNVPYLDRVRNDTFYPIFRF